MPRHAQRSSAARPPVRRTTTSRHRAEPPSAPRRVSVRPAIAGVVAASTLALLAALLPGQGWWAAASDLGDEQTLDAKAWFRASEDVTLTAGRTNRGAETVLQVAPQGDRTLLKFATNDQGELAAATLSVHVAELGGPVRLAVRGVTADGWTESTATAEAAPAPGAPEESTPTVDVTRAGWVDLPVPTTLVQSPQAALEVVAVGGDAGVDITSREGGQAPVLGLTWKPWAGKPVPTLTTSPTTSPSTPPTTAPTSSPTSTTRTTSPSTTASPTTTTPTSSPSPTTTSPGVLPFDMTVDPRSTQRLAFAHYFTPYPVSMDDKDAASDYYTRNYLSPTGESGKHAAYGGLLRDRPLPRPVIGTGWRDADLRTEVRQARAAGLDGFTVDVLNIRGTNWDRIVALLAAAKAVDPDFMIVLQPDMTTLNDETPEALATAMAQLADQPSAGRLSDGRLIISPFKAEAKSASWWGSWLTTMRTQHGENVAFVPTFLDWRANMDAFAPISYGFSAWGERSPAQTASMVGAGQKADQLGKIWMAPVAVQDVRPNQSTYWEAGNTETLRGSWNAAIQGGAEWVHIPTWNDYSENASIAPSANHGYTFVDASAYWMTQWKKGTAPTLKRDAVYVTSRIQPVAARPTFAQTKLMTLRSNSIPARDTVEALVFLTAPATIKVTVGSTVHTWEAPAGVSAKTFPLATGTVKASITRGGSTIGTAQLPKPVTSTPYVQDLSYYGDGSLR